MGFVSDPEFLASKLSESPINNPKRVNSGFDSHPEQNFEICNLTVERSMNAD